MTEDGEGNMLVQKYLSKAASNVLASLASFVSLMVMTRYVSVEYGVMMWGWAFVSMFNAFSDIGFDSANMKMVSEGQDRDECLSTFFTVKMTLTVLVIVLTVVSLMVTEPDLSPEAVSVIAVFLVYIVVLNIVNTLAKTMDGRLHSGKSAIVYSVEYTVRSVALIILALMGVDAVTLSYGYVIGIVSSLAVTLYLFGWKGYGLTRPKLIRKYVSFAMPISVGILLVTALTYMDKVIIGFWCGSLEVGYYTAATGFIWAFQSLGTSLNTVVLPQFSKLMKNDEKEGVVNALWTAQKFVSVFFLPIVAFLIVFGPQTATVLYGENYVESGLVLSAMAPVVYLFLMVGMNTQVLYATNNSRLYLRAVLIYALTTVVGFVLLIPDDILGMGMAGLGAQGAALSVSLGYVLFLTAISVIVKKSVGVSMHPRTPRYIGASVVLLAIMYLINENIQIEGLFGIALASVLCLSLYLLILYVMGDFGKEDVEYLLNAINPKAIKDNLSEEIRDR